MVSEADTNTMIVIVRENLKTKTNDNIVNTMAATMATMATWVQCSGEI